MSPEQKAVLGKIVETGPAPEIDGVVRWCRIDLQRIIKERFGLAYHERHVGTFLKELGFSRLSGRPQHPQQDNQVIEMLKNFADMLSAHLRGRSRTKRIEIWFQDEARIGQKNARARIWTRKGNRSRLPADQRYKLA